MLKIKKLEDASLENVSGGILARDVLHHYSIVTIPLGVIGALGCSIAESVSQFMASMSMQQGDETKNKKYSKTAANLGVASILFAGLATSGLITAAPLALERYQPGYK